MNHLNKQEIRWLYRIRLQYILCKRLELCPFSSNRSHQAHHLHRNNRICILTPGNTVPFRAFYQQLTRIKHILFIGEKEIQLDTFSINYQNVLSHLLEWTILRVFSGAFLAISKPVMFISSASFSDKKFSITAKPFSLNCNYERRWILEYFKI